MPKHSNQDRIIRMFAEIQDHIYNGRIKNELSQIAKHTRDPIIIEICSRVAIFLKIQIDTSFHQENPDRIRQSQQRLINHLKWPKDKFDEILKILPDYNSKWINCLFELTQEQLIYLSQ